MGGGAHFRGFGAEGRETHIFLGMMAERSETQMLGFLELRENDSNVLFKDGGGGLI